MTILLDASALLAMLNDEAGGDRVAAVIADAQMSVINLFNRVVSLQDYETVYGQTAGGAYRNYYNFGQPKFMSTPRYVRFQVQYDF